MDHVAAGPHRLDRRLAAPPRRARSPRRRARARAAAARCARSCSRPRSAISSASGRGIRCSRISPRARREVQRRPVLAGEEVVEVARGEQEASAALQHRLHHPGGSGRMRAGNRRAAAGVPPTCARPLVLLAAAAVALGPAAAASAKEIASVKVCGADGCHDVTDRATHGRRRRRAAHDAARRAGALLPDQGQDQGRGRREHPGLDASCGSRRPSCCRATTAPGRRRRARPSTS